VELAVVAAERSDTLSRGGDNYNLQPNELKKSSSLFGLAVFVNGPFVHFRFDSAAGFSSFDFLARRAFEIFEAQVVIFQ